MEYKVEYENLPWACECCGYGDHERVTLWGSGDKIKSWSHNDQFGGQLDEEDLPFPVLYGDGESFARGIYTGLMLAGHSVFYERVTS